VLLQRQPQRRDVACLGGAGEHRVLIGCVRTRISLHDKPFRAAVPTPQRPEGDEKSEGIFSFLRSSSITSTAW
jgi:hypothetical protein